MLSSLLSLSLSRFVSVSVPLSLSFSLSLPLSLSLFVSLCLFFSLSQCLSGSVFLSLSRYLSLFLFLIYFAAMPISSFILKVIVHRPHHQDGNQRTGNQGVNLGQIHPSQNNTYLDIKPIRVKIQGLKVTYCIL